MFNDSIAPLEPDFFYHIFNQGNARVKVFYNKENYTYFLKKLDIYLSDFTEIYSYCLMPNHFHILIRIKSTNEILGNAYKIDELKRFLNRHEKDVNLPELLISEIFRRFFMSYAKAINKQQNRTGSLFRKNFKRIKVTDLKYLKTVVVYIHRNPKRHGFDIDFRDYPWSSYNKILEEKITRLKKEEVLDWFGDRESYIANH
jgi:putative transposase